MVWKSHDDSIAQRSAIDQARHEKIGGNGPHNNSGKRREPTIDAVEVEKTKIVPS
jgi:translation initiation factor 4E